MPDDSMHWADQTARKIVQVHQNKKTITCAAGITPSGVVHIGNFREIVTVDLISRALVDALKGSGKKVRFIYSWDDYDVFRKIPPDMPNQEMLKEHLRKAIVDVPDPYGKEESYARHNEVEIEKHMPILGINPEYVYQSKKYRACEYSDQIKKALENKDKIVEILNKYREEPLGPDWLPIRIFCEKCGLDTVEKISYAGGYDVSYECDCGFKDTFDLRSKGVAKLQWRVDWPMRWAYEQVAFEPGGKDHSTQGGSYDTGKEIVKEVYECEAPLYIMYDFIRIKGQGGKISSSKGGVITIKEVLEVYEPAMVRWLFAGTRPGAEFAISFDMDVLKLYEDFDRCERMYYGKEEVKNDKDAAQQKRIYELSAIDPESIAKDMPVQPGFRHLTTIIQIFEHDIEKVIEFYKKNEGVKSPDDIERVSARAHCASLWLKKYAPEDMVFVVNEESPQLKFHPTIRIGLKEFIRLLLTMDSQDAVESALFDFCKANDIPTKEFFTSAYRILISKEQGPKLVPFVYAIGKDRVLRLLQEALSR